MTESAFPARLAIPGTVTLSENKLLFLITLMGSTVVIVKTDSDLQALGLFCSCAMLFLLARAFLGNTLSLNYLTLPSVFMFSYLIVMSIPSIWTFTELQHPIRYTYFSAVQSVLITFPLGVSLANFFFRHPSKTVQDYLQSDLKRTREDFKFIPVFIVLILSLCPLLSPYFMLAEHIQLSEVIKSYPTPIDPVSLRFAEGDLPRVVQFCFEIARRFVLPVCALYAYLMSWIYRGKWVFVFWMLFCGTLAVASLTLDRAEPFAFLNMMILAYILARRQTIGRAIRNPKLVMAFVLIIAMAGIISVPQYQSIFTLRRVLEDIWHVLLYRVFQSPAYMASLAFVVFNDPSLFVHGRYERIFSFLPGFEYVESLDSRGLAVAPLTFVGDLWGNWGWCGVIVGTITIGFVFQLIQLTAFTRKSVPNLALYVVMLCDAVWIIYGKALGIMTVSVLLFGLLLALFFRSGRGAFRQVRAASMRPSLMRCPGRTPR